MRRDQVIKLHPVLYQWVHQMSHSLLQIKERNANRETYKKVRTYLWPIGPDTALNRHLAFRDTALNGYLAFRDLWVQQEDLWISRDIILNKS